ncbi:hypothetical protein [Treponema sp.]|uniref:hypothetical protein n=1 Tax=Treponema sp. TaxID=166 RepID=UPI00298D7289|nr:hypothetical protein [Treponema sp.]MCR5613231.1 hypothetical protein [Treponema sp.]
MITLQNYTSEEIDLLYSVVEDAVKNKKPVDLFSLHAIIKPGDFYLRGNAANGYVFQFNGLKWIEDGEIYNCLIQPQIRFNDVLPIWVPVITYNDRNYSSSGRLSMIKKENRYIKC